MRQRHLGILAINFSSKQAPLVVVLPGLRDTRIRLWAIADGSEEPRQIRSAILLVSAEVVDAESVEIAEEQRAPSPVAIAVAIFCECKEGIKLRSCGRNDAADTIRLASTL